MSPAKRDFRGHSADVRMQLCVNGHVFAIGQLGPDFVILDEPADRPPAEAEITLSIEGRVRRWSFHLPDGVAADKPETRISYLAPQPNGPTVR